MQYYVTMLSGVMSVLFLVLALIFAIVPKQVKVDAKYVPVSLLVAYLLSYSFLSTSFILGYVAYRMFQ